VNDVLLLESTSKFVRQCRDKSSSLCLRLWQELLIMHSVAQSAAADEKLKGLMNTMENLVLTVNESREYLQLLLPAHIFLASVTALLKEGDSIDIRTKALRLVAERVPDVDPYGEEVPLFMEMVPDIVDVLRSTDGSNGSEESSKILLLRQSALVAVEHIARCFSVGGGITASNTQHFLSALGRATDLLQFPCQVLAQPNASLSHIDNAARQIISSVALSSATLVRTTGPLCISTLPKLIKRLMSALTSANSYVLLNGNTSDDNETFAQAKVMQASILRALSAIAFSVPQFLPSYLHLVLNESNILSPSLRQDRDSVMKSTIERLDQLLSARIPPRLMIPAIVKATGQCKNATTVAVLLKMLKISVEQCTGAEAVAQRNAVLKVVTQAYENQSSLESGALLVHTANDALMTFILKLSEVHLRRLYLSLRDWRGVVDKLAPESSSAHRFAFWTLSAALAKRLRSIFLPCLSVSIGDAVSELELAASSLCQSGNAVKKRKLNDERTESSYDSVSMQVVQPVLLCLEHALRADGLDGGSWIRADENQRYHALLEPMGKLLQARIPGNFLKENDHLSSPFARVIVGEYSDLGNVVSCLSALANAAGNEQLWKPLNYYVLEACGNESRGEVRKAGLTCLVSLMKSLGEEYMVLLPECLPILSELLEDTDEEIAGLAKECVTLAEDLLGTSLEDSLR
jgi:U3 small nucleolar RNA-associated protein 10